MRLLPLLLLGTACADRVKIDDGQRMNTVFQAKDWFTSFFVRAVPDGVVLFDAGFRKGASERALNDLGHDLGEVTHVFLTHGHGDHLGLLSELPNAEVVGLGPERTLVEEESDARITTVVEDGDILDVGVDVEVFAVPGHTPGSAVYFVDGVLLLGDSAIVNRDGQLVPVNEDRSDDPDQLVRSMQALADRLAYRRDEVDWLAPSHSAPLRGFGPLEAFGR